MGLLTEAAQLLIPRRRALGIEGPYPLTAAHILSAFDGVKTAAGASVTPDKAMTVSAVWACVSLVARDVARTPTPLYLKGERSREPADGDPRYHLLRVQPNPFMSAHTFKATLQAHLMLRGNAFAEVERDERGRVRWLWPLHPGCMEKPVLSEAGTLLYTYHLPNGERRALVQDEVLHIRGLSPDGIWGYSPVHLHRESIGLAMAQREYGNRFYGNNSVPGGVLQKKDGQLSEEAANRLRVQWEQLHRGLENAHKVAILEEGLEWHQIGITHRDAQYLEGMKFSRVEIAASIYHVPPHKIGEMDRATFSNIEEQDIDYQGATLDAEYSAWEQELNVALLRPDEQSRLYFEFNRNALVRSRLLERMEAYEKAWFLTPNEKRAMENKNPLPGFDEPFIPVNNVMPLSKIPEPVPAGAGSAAP